MNWVENIGKTPGLAFASVTQVAGWAIEAGAVAHDQVGAIGRSLFQHLQSIPGVSLDVAGAMQKAVEEAMKEVLAKASDGMPKLGDLQRNAEAMIEAAFKLHALGEHMIGASTYLLSDEVFQKGMLVCKGFEEFALLAGSLQKVADKLAGAWFLTRNAKGSLTKLSGRFEAINQASLCLKDCLNEVVKHRSEYAEALQKAAGESQRGANELKKLANSVRRLAASCPVP